MTNVSGPSIAELMQDLHDIELERSSWSLEQVIEHACSLAMGYGAGRDDLREEFLATKERALRMARQSRVRAPSQSRDPELEAAKGVEAVADLLTRWQDDQSEYFTNPTLEIVAEYAAWRERVAGAVAPLA
jgi:hypothetical protein